MITPSVKSLCAKWVVLSPGGRELQPPSSGREAEPLVAPSDLSMWADIGRESGNLCSGNNKEKENRLMSLVPQSQLLPKVLKLKRLKQNFHFLDHAYTSTTCFNMFCFRQLVLRKSVSLHPSAGCNWSLAPWSSLSHYISCAQAQQGWSLTGIGCSDIRPSWLKPYYGPHKPRFRNTWK